MRRKIGFEFVAIIFFAMLAFIIGGFFIVRNNFNDVTQYNLETYLEIMKSEYNHNPTPTYIVDKYEEVEDYIRITFIDSTGVVLVDSLAEDLENHINRPEIQNVGTTYIRQSDTLDIEMMYLAYEFDDGNYLRLAIPTSSMLPFTNDFVILSIIIGVVIITITFFIGQALINNAMYPLKEIKIILRNVNKGEYKEILPVKKQDEINGLLTEINDINQLIAKNISSLTSEKEKNDFLLNHMNQGICVLDNNGLIVMINQNLRELYRFNIDINLNKDYRFLFRNSDVQQYIKNAYEKQTNTNTILNIRERYYSVSINYLEKNWLNSPCVILLYTDITDIKNIENLKKDFFDNASHELKSPLTSILGSSEIILQGMSGDEKTKEDLIKRISEEAKRMNNLVMDMLTLSKYENQIQIQNKTNIDIDKVLNDVISSLKRQIEKRDIKLNINSKSDYINANYDEMFQLIKNLLENAVKYGKDSGEVSIDVLREDSNLVIKVSDDGIGIPKSDQSRIFERFYRVDKARSKLTGGTGLGLSIVKHITLNYGGHIELDSIEKQGTTITIYIPSNQIKIK
ncbi:sensor histidine kinase [Candidatus Izemoplasma sp. B36]|uniref:sensor histidine kinase n=1 Tax=Candidatus Izemoplasma sp. B36 TaxID=3242468 RepID=UPI003558A460